MKTNLKLKKLELRSCVRGHKYQCTSSDEDESKLSVYKTYVTYVLYIQGFTLVPA